MRALSFIVAGLICVSSGFALKPATGGQFPQEYLGWIEISPGNKIFYEIQSTIESASQRASSPMLQFISGGPCASSTGFSGMLEVGKDQLIANPKNTSEYEIIQRKHTWASMGTLILADLPAGTGWSIVNSTQDYCTTDECIGKQTVAFWNGFLKKHPEYSGKQLYLHGESYSGGIISTVGNAMLDANVNVDIKAVTSADGWVNPVTICKSYGQYFETFSQINEAQRRELDALALQMETAVEEGNGTKATNLWGTQQGLLEMFNGGSNIYNILFYQYYLESEGLVRYYMNSKEFRAKIEQYEPIPAGASYGGNSSMCFPSMGEYFMMSKVQYVERLLNRNMTVNVIHGAEDGIVCGPGVAAWMKQLSWPKLQQFNAAPRIPVPNAEAGVSPSVGFYTQCFDNLCTAAFNSAGHLLPHDQPANVMKFYQNLINYGVAHSPADVQQAKDRRSGSTQTRPFGV